MSKRQEKIAAMAAARPIGCTLKADLLKHGFALDRDVAGPAHKLLNNFRFAAQQVSRIPAILDPVDRVKPDEPLDDWTFALPPFELQWIETVFDELRFGCVVGSSKPEPGQPRSVMMFGFSQHKDNIIRRPKAVAWIRLEVDDAGTAVKKIPAQMFIEKDGQKEARSALLYAYAIVKTIQIMTATSSVGLHEIVHKDANDVRLPRRQRQQAFSERYHVLVVKNPRTGKVVYDDAPDGRKGIMPKHVARGHWARYGPEFNAGLLFGKYSGRVWVPDADKGDEKNGVIKKDYAIVATESFAAATSPSNVDHQSPHMGQEEHAHV